MKLDLPPAPRVAIVRLSALGDVICALPVATAVRRHRPEAEISWLVENASADLVRHHPDVDRVIELPRKHVRKAWRRPWTVPAAIGEVRRRIRAGRGDRPFDLVLDLQGNSKSGLVTGLAGGRIRVGHDGTFRKEIVNALFSNRKVHPVPAGEATRHRVERDLGFVRALGIPAAFEPRALEIPAEPEAAAAAFVEGLAGDGPVVAIHPGTSAFGAFKRWAPDRFAAVADRLVREKGARVAFSWGPDEAELVDEVVAQMRERATRFPPPDGLLNLAAIYRRVDLVIGADSGPLHLAAVMGTPTLTLFGPKDPEIYKPIGAASEVVYKGVDCSPCKLRYCDHVTCMRTMEVDDVAAPALRMLD